MIKQFFSENYKKPLFWIIPAAVLVCAAAAVIAITNPFGKAEGEPKKDMSSQEVTGKEDDASKDDTASGKDTEKEKEETDSKPVTSENPVTSSEPEESDEYINERDNFGNLDLKIVKDIKDTLDLRFGEYSVEDIYIEKYYGTYSDGSVVISVGFEDKYGGNYYYPAVEIVSCEIDEIIGHLITPGRKPYVYYKGRVELLDVALQDGLISQSGIEKLFKDYPEIIEFENNIYNERDDYGDLSKSVVYRIKSHYLYYLCSLINDNNFTKKLKLSDICIEKYYGHRDDGKIIVVLSYDENLRSDETVVDELGKYNYMHKEKQGIFIFTDPGNKTTYSLTISPLKECYNTNLWQHSKRTVTDSDLKNIFAKFPEFLKK